MNPRQFALYADSERGRYPVWQGLDLKGFLPGSGILFVTTTVSYFHTRLESSSHFTASGRAIIRNASRPFLTPKYRQR